MSKFEIYIVCSEDGCEKSSEWQDEENQTWCEEHRHSTVCRLEAEDMKRILCHPEGKVWIKGGFIRINKL